MVHFIFCKFVNGDPDPAFFLNADLDPGFDDLKLKKFYSWKFNFNFLREGEYVS